MTYKMPLRERERRSRNRNAQYRSDPAFRLACINAARAHRGASPIASLDEVGTRRPVETRVRDERGRFAGDAL